MPPVASSEPFPSASARISGVISGYLMNQAGLRVLPRVSGIETVDIAEQNQQFSPRIDGHKGGQCIVGHQC